MAEMPRTKQPAPSPAEPGHIAGFGRYAGPATLILSSLAEGPKHGYTLTKDIERFADMRLAPAPSTKP